MGGGGVLKSRSRGRNEPLQGGGQEIEMQMERSPAGEGETGSEKREGTPAGKEKGKNRERRQ